MAGQPDILTMSRAESPLPSHVDHTQHLEAPAPPAGSFFDEHRLNPYNLITPIKISGDSYFDLSQRARKTDSPRLIITADCSEPQEIDDGIFVQSLPYRSELYRVGVCVADTSSLYNNGQIFQSAMKRTAARYWTLPNGERGYEPMIPHEHIKPIQLAAGNERKAMIVSFVIGKTQPPTDLHINFDTVFVLRNLDYREFSRQSVQSKQFNSYRRAGQLIMNHLRYTSGGDDRGSSEFANGGIPNNDAAPSTGHWYKGSKLNEAFMIAANHLVATTLASENRPAIYRIHNPNDQSLIEFLPPNFATYSRVPGRHHGLNLEPLCRITSPLRRLEDFVMNYQLKQRFLGRAATLKDVSDVAAAVQQLNRHIAREVFEGPLRMGRSDTLGNNPTSLHVVPDRDGSDGRAIA